MNSSLGSCIWVFLKLFIQPLYLSLLKKINPFILKVIIDKNLLVSFCWLVFWWFCASLSFLLSFIVMWLFSGQMYLNFSVLFTVLEIELKASLARQVLCYWIIIPMWILSFKVCKSPVEVFFWVTTGIIEIANSYFKIANVYFKLITVYFLLCTKALCLLSCHLLMIWCFNLCFSTIHALINLCSYTYF